MKNFTKIKCFVNADPWMISALAVFLVLSFFTAWSTQDDAFISMRFARNLAHGNGLRFNGFENPPVEGYTNFSWVLLLVFPHLFKLDALLYVKILGYLSGIFFLLVAMASLRTRNLNPVLTRLGIWIIAINVTVTFWTLSGMETVFYSACCAVALLCATPEKFQHKGALPAAVWSILAFLTRPDGILVCMTIGITLVMYRKRNDVSGACFIRYILIVGGSGLVYAIWKFAYFHSVVPNTFYAKVGADFLEELSDGCFYIYGWLKRWAWPLCLCALFAVVLEYRKPHVFLLSLFCCFYIFFIAKVGGDFMRFHRFFVPVLIPLTCLAATGVESVLRFVPRHSKRRQTLMWMAVIILLAGYLAPNLVVHSRNLKVWLQGNYKSEDKARNVILAKWLNNNVPNQTTLATFNIGRLAYYSHCDVIDSLGLTDRDIACKLRYGDDCELGREILRKKPDILVPQLIELRPSSTGGWQSLFYDEWKDLRQAPSIVSLLNWDRLDEKGACPDVIRTFRKTFRRIDIADGGYRFVLFVRKDKLNYVKNANFGEN